MPDFLQGRIVVVSPHLDDAVLSLGATITAAAHRGASITVLTVFCGDPFSQAPSGPWDLKSGFSTEGEASRARREEDRQACAILGVKPYWLSFGDEQYDRHGDGDRIAAAVTAAIAGADTVLIPGWPLLNPDHSWLTSRLLGRRIEIGRLGMYVEQPYTFQSHSSLLGVAEPLQPLFAEPRPWQRMPSSKRDRQLKRKAAEMYASQLRQLGLGYVGLRRFLADERKRGGEAVCWLSDAEAASESHIA
jgi:LmbE family N-acetylglucosaminyl deacetylase